jgi:hypothetical protein
MAQDKVFTQWVEDEVDAILDSEAFLNTLLGGEDGRKVGSVEWPSPAHDLSSRATSPPGRGKKGGVLRRERGRRRAHSGAPLQQEGRGDEQTDGSGGRRRVVA